MAIERRAIFALSIAFTASIVAYPDLPADIPPRAGRDGAFVGAPFVAFLLPLAAAAIWWIAASLRRHAPRERPRAIDLGAATALFLSAFHVITLIAFIGGRPWLGRILGATVGLFLIVSGNELPRARAGLLWNTRHRSMLSDGDSWRRGRRLGGYIRVTMGIVVCVAALIGLGNLPQLIVLAVCVEGAASAGAAPLLPRRKNVAIGVLALCGSAVSAAADAQGISPEKIAALPPLIDEMVPRLMERGHVPGAAVVVVHDGRIVFLRGYGRSRLDPDANVDPSRTLFRIGSVSKVLTSVAALQLAEAGALDLQRDVRAYVPEFPLQYGATTHQLLTHTAGLDERLASVSTGMPDPVLSLADRLRLEPPKQVIRPGKAYSYSNSNFELTGLVVEKASGLAYEQYMAERIFGPLRMTGTTAHQPPEPRLAKDLARGYRWTGRIQQAIPYQARTSSSPSGGICTTAADMGRFMLAVLGEDSGAGRILSPAVAERLFAPQYTPDPRIAPRAYAALQWLTRGRRLYHHDGTNGDQIAVLVLAPDERLGIFAASNGAPGEANSVGNAILAPVLTHLLGPPAIPPPPPASLPGALSRAHRFAGTYRGYRITRSDITRLVALMPMSQPRVTVESDGALRWKGHRWIEVAPLVFRSTDPPDYSADNPDHIVFRENDRGEIVELHAWGEAYERIGWTEQAPFHLTLLACCLVMFTGYGASLGIRELRGGNSRDDGRAARRLALVVSLVNIIFVAGLPVFFRALRLSMPLPAPVVVLWLALPLVSVAATSLLPGFAALAWRERWWTRGARLRFSAMALLSVAFMAFLNYWKLLAIRY